MPRYIAFLRGINVGGHRVTMDDLREIFGALSFSSVETFIASGNVIFDTTARDTAKLENRIERHLRQSLGYDADTFIRTPTEIAAIAQFRPFAPADMDAADHSINVTFLRSAPDAAASRAFSSLRTDMDEFHVEGRELFWLCRGKITQSSIAAPVLNKTFKSMPGTMRNMKTVHKLAAQYAINGARR